MFSQNLIVRAYMKENHFNVKIFASDQINLSFLLKIPATTTFAEQLGFILSIRT
jgi:hypothetical protein